MPAIWIGSPIFTSSAPTGHFRDCRNLVYPLQDFIAKDRKQKCIKEFSIEALVGELGILRLAYIYIYIYIGREFVIFLFHALTQISHEFSNLFVDRFPDVRFCKIYMFLHF